MLTKSPDSFAAVARKIANPSPAWLPLYLEQFHAFISTKQVSDEDYQFSKRVIGQMRYSADYLIKHLPAFFLMPGFGRSPDVADTIALLTMLRNSLDRLVKRPARGGGQRPDVQRGQCAAVIVEAWKDIHGNVKPQGKVLAACAAYWEACGHEERDAENWGRDTKHALANPNEVVRAILNYHKTHA